ncbi:unnamed protein product [Arctia plantaginis]|uniref:Uncharacterized protein n=1 Tax=Arctia plantaginis TaxID=874455 RepID=A0A8S1B2X7_ARCPL|nr:unnamed protein product [Arctia plantaginis]
MYVVCVKLLLNGSPLRAVEKNPSCAYPSPYALATSLRPVQALLAPCSSTGGSVQSVPTYVAVAVPPPPPSPVAPAAALPPPIPRLLLLPPLPSPSG